MKQGLLFIILLFFTSYAFTQDTAKSKKDTINLKNVSVTGIRGDAQTPVSQKTLTKADISKIYQGQEMTYLLSNTPSITYQSDGGQPNGYTTFRLRGIDQTRINMTLNNCPLNESEDMGVYFSNYPDFAINIQSLQIQRGVGTSSNGVASFGGSVNFEGQTGLNRGGEVQLGYGSFNTSHFNISNNTGLGKNKLALFTSLSAYNSDGYKYHSGGQGYSAFASGGYYGSKDIIKFTGFTGGALNDMAWLAVSATDIDKDPRTNYNPKGENDNFSQSFGQLQYTRLFTKNSYLTTTVFYNRLDGRWGIYLDETNPAPTGLLQYHLHSNFYGVISNYHLETNHLKFNMGLSGNAYNRNHSATLPDTARLYTNTGYKNELSAYAKAGYDIGKFTAFADLQQRYVDFRYVGDVQTPELYWNFFNPKAGVTYNYNDNINYYFSVGQSHREPTRTDMFNGNDNLILPLGNTIPEKVIDYELGTNIKYNNLKIQGNLYYMDFHNEITLLGALGSNGLPLMTTVNKSYRSGVEIDLSYKINSSFAITNASNFSRNYFTGSGGRFQPLYTPTVVVNQGIQFSYSKFSIQLSAKYQNESFISLDNKYTALGVIIFNANASYKLKKVTLMLQGNNLTNRRYFTNGYVVSNEKYYFVNAPLSGYVTVKYDF